MSAASYGLMDRETANLIGVYPSLAAALHDVLEAMHRYGRDSHAVQSLVLAREDVDPNRVRRDRAYAPGPCARRR